MQKIPLPKNINVEEDKENKNHAIVTIGPCYPGYGTTIGNALRRVLLSSLPGAAVTAFKVKGAPHEFSTIPGVKEDVVDIMLNLKQLHLRVFNEEPVELNLNVKGEKPVKACDISKNSDVEIINQNLVICHLTDKNVKLEMKIWVEPGRGYVPVDEKRDVKPEIGVIQIDAFYSPIEKVGFRKENVRVGERTNYDKLILDIETDGTITPEGAVLEAGKILVEQFSFVASDGKVEEKKEDEQGISEEVDVPKEEKVEDSETAGEDEEAKEEKQEENQEEKPASPSQGEPKKKRGRPKKVEKVIS
ncbi:DNA-directed RNA polymerase subunit alpha [Patescibacteria group bacterium]|nr:DNA-directed RNA polymerase subunit alpha [Patescibacteria group bacterium]MBU4512921.1 DNA-directed RNA polymerase subunit alpha [Patescibacteria group bacterium]